MKICTKCGTEKPLSDFYKQAKAKDGHHSACAECSKKKALEWYEANREKIKARLTDSRREKGVSPRPPKAPKGAYYERVKNDPEFKRKRKEYAAKRWSSIAEESKKRATAWAKANPERTAEIAKASRTRKQMEYILRNIRKRAKARGVPFNLELSDIQIPEVCPIFGAPLVYGAVRGKDDFAPSIDRKIPALGYVKGNIQVMSRLANCMKWTATEEQLIAFARGVLRQYG